MRTEPWLLALALLAMVEIVWRLLVAYVLPPLGFDALWYHLTTVAGWLQAGKIVASPLALWSAVYPANGELFFAWPSLFLHSDTIVDAVQLGFAVIGAIAVAGLARCVGLSTRAAAAAGFLFLLTPVVLSQSTSNYVDIVFTSTFLVAFYFVLRFLQATPFAWAPEGREHPDLRLATLGGIAAGIALGTKTLGILYCAALTALLAGQVWVAALRRRVSPRLAAASLLCFVAPLIALGGFWYVRTWVRYGNPIYPVRVDLLGVTLFPGLPAEDFLSLPDYRGPWWIEVLSQWHRDLYLGAGTHYYTIDARPGGFGPVWSYLATWLLPLFTLVALRRHRATVVNFLLLVGIVFLAQPYKWWSRFTMLLLAAGMIAVAYWMDRAPRTLSRIAKGATAALVGAGLWFCTARIDRTFSASRILSWLTRPERERTIGRVAYPWFRWVDSVAPRARIGADTTTGSYGSAPLILFFYPLYGRHFSHSVYPLEGNDERQFRRYVASRRLEYVIVGPSKFGRLAKQAADDGCLRIVSDSQKPLTWAYRVAARCVTPRG